MVILSAHGVVATRRRSPYLYLYDEGVGGGDWQEAYVYYGYVDFEADHIKTHLNAADNAPFVMHAYAATKDKIDLTAYSLLEVEVDAAASSNRTIGTSTSNSDSSFTEYISGNHTSLDISGVSGEYYIKIGCNKGPYTAGDMAVKWQKVWLS